MLRHRTTTNPENVYSGRLIVGFSLRQSPLSFDKSEPSGKCPFLDGPDLIFHHPISLGFDYWDVVDEDDFSAERNGMNLLSLPDTFGLDAAVPEKSCILAVDMRANEALTLEERFGLCLLPAGLISLSSNWCLLGYDVVAPGGLTSGLYQYDWRSLSHEEKKRFPRAEGNQFGLVKHESEAEELAAFFNAESLHHAPYYAMGLWIKTQTQKKSLYPGIEFKGPAHA